MKIKIKMSKKLLYVVRDIQLPNRQRLIGAHLTPALHSRFQMKKAFRRILRTHPEAYCMSLTAFY